MAKGEAVSLRPPPTPTPTLSHTHTPPVRRAPERNEEKNETEELDCCERKCLTNEA